MRLLQLACSLACYIHSTSAFFPYHLDFPKLEETPSTPSSRRDIDHSSSHSRHVRAPLRKILKKRKNNFNIIHANTPKQSNSVGADQDGTDFSYFCGFQFGTSKETFYLLLDTAASNTWVMSSDCTTDACTSHSTFGPGDSTSLQTSQNQFSISYGTGSVSGTTATDTVSFLSTSFSLTFGLASTVSSEFASYPMDGILGLARPENLASNPTGVRAPTLMDVLISQKVITSKQVGIRLSRTSDGPNDGEVNFGGPDMGVIDGSLNYIPTLTNTNGFWEIPIDSLSVDGKSGTLPQGRTALLDSGTSFMLLPPADAAVLHGLIPGSAQSGDDYTLPCDTKLTITLGFGGKKYDINYKDYVGRQVGDGKCASNIVAKQVFADGQWLVGDVFLKNVYALFDYDGSRIGLGYLKGSSTTGTSTSSSAKPTTKGATSTKSSAHSTSTAHSLGGQTSGSSDSTTATNSASGSSPSKSTSAAWRASICWVCVVGYTTFRLAVW